MPLTVRVSRLVLLTLLRAAAGKGLRLDHLRGSVASGTSPLLPVSDLMPAAASMKGTELRLDYDGFGTLSLTDEAAGRTVQFSVKP